ncbi:hypothetical protein LINGRAHAP2_LOCUS12880 [Linum grandiflorum]
MGLQVATYPLIH